MTNKTRYIIPLKRPWVLSPILMLFSCVYLHKAQLGEIDDRPGWESTSFEVKVSETGVNIEEVGALLKTIGKANTQDTDSAFGVVKLFQLGPVTGQPVYNESYAENILMLIREKCPTGKVSGLSSIRETRRYPAISGEIVKITGYCLRKKR